MENDQPNANEILSVLPRVENINITDLVITTPEIGGTEIVLQRNAKDNRDPNSDIEIGALVPDSAEKVKIHTRESLRKIFESLTPEDRLTIDVLVVAADTKLETPIPEIKSDHKRAVETGEQVIEGIRECMQELAVPESQLLNKTGKPIELTSGKLKDLHMFEDSPEFVSLLIEKYGTGVEFWAAYEDDTEKETRESMKAEGPKDIADRVNDYLRVVSNAMKFYHEAHPGRRVIVFAETHYDTISPFVKQHVTRSEMSKMLRVENGAGVVINLDKDRKASSTIKGNTYELNLS